MSTKTYHKIQSKYGGEFVAFRSDKVVAHAPDVKKLYQQMERNRVKRDGKTTVGFVPRKDACYVL